MHITSLVPTSYHHCKAGSASWHQKALPIPHSVLPCISHHWYLLLITTVRLDGSASWHQKALPGSVLPCISHHWYLASYHHCKAGSASWHQKALPIPHSVLPCISHHWYLLLITNAGLVVPPVIRWHYKAVCCHAYHITGIYMSPMQGW